MQDSKPRPLIVDDDQFNIEIIRGFLEDEDYRLDAARDGLEAWEVLERDPEAHDAILLDRMMPRMDGMELLKRIKKARPVHETARALILSLAQATPSTDPSSRPLLLGGQSSIDSGICDTALH